MPEHKNMCDGCERRLPIVEGMHKEPSTYGWTYCTKDRYVPTEECKMCEENLCSKHIQDATWERKGRNNWILTKKGNGFA